MRWIVAMACLGLVGVAQAQDSTVERRQAVADRGVLVLRVPATWKQELRGATIRYRPASGRPFEVLITPALAAKSVGDPRTAVAGAADQARARAVEGVIPVNDLLGTRARGYYFKATDRAPKPREYKHLAQGIVTIDDVHLAFTVLTNDGQDGVVDSVFSMLRSVRFEAAQASAQASAAAPGALPKPDRPALRALLEKGAYAELDAALSAYQNAYRAGTIDDDTAAEPFVALNGDDPDARAAYDKWVAAMPKSFVARLARGYHLMGMGYLARGNRYMDETSRAQVAEMREIFSAAMADLTAATALDSKPTLVYGTMIAIAQGTGTREQQDQYLATALALDPRAFVVRTTYLAGLQPQWDGRPGALQRMEQTVVSWKGAVTEKQYKALLRQVEDAKWRERLEPANVLLEQRRCPEAIPFLNKVIAEAEVPRAYALRGACNKQILEFDQAIADYTRYLDMGGKCCSLVRGAGRADTWLKLGAIDKALPELQKAALEDDDAWAARELSRIYLSGKYGVAKDLDAARRWCERAARQGDPLSMYCLAGMMDAGVGGPVDQKGAVRWYGRAAERGIADAQADYASILWTGRGVEKDHPRAIKFWRAAARQGNGRAKAQLERNVEGWDYFSKVTFPDWVEDNKRDRRWLYVCLYYLGLTSDV